MKPREILELVVRLMGVVFLYQALASVPSAIANFCPIFPHLNFRSLFPSAILIGCPLIIGWYLFKGAPWLMAQAYPEKQNATSVRNEFQSSQDFQKPGGTANQL
jgi:hypothetical protein